MAGYEDIIMDYNATKAAKLDHIQISEDETAVLKSLGEVHDDLINLWYGESGEVFRQMASTIEVEMGDAVMFSDNCSVANDHMIINSNNLDNDRANSIEVATDENSDG